MANIFREPLTIIQGTGVTVNPDNAELKAKSRETVTISIGNDVSVTSNPIFSTLTLSNEQFQINQYIIKSNALTGSISLLGSLTSDSLTIGGDMSVLGTTTAQKIESQLSESVTLFESGSTQFGDTSDDTHQFSGSFSSSGSFSVGNHSVNSVSNDTSLTDGSSTDLVTEKAVKTYLDANDDDTIPQMYTKSLYIVGLLCIVSCCFVLFEKIFLTAAFHCPLTNDFPVL